MKFQNWLWSTVFAFGILSIATTVAPSSAAPPTVDAEGVRAQPGTPADAVMATNESAADASAVGPIEAPILDTDSSQLTYQALLTDSRGNPLPGPDVKLEFRIYDSAGGLIEGPIGPILVPVNNGVVDTLFPVLAKSFNGDARELGISVNGAREMRPRVKLAAVPYAFRVDRVKSEELDDSIELGTTTANGTLSLWSAANDVRSIKLEGASHKVSTWGSDGNERVRLWGPAWGEALLFDGTGNDRTVRLSAGPTSILPGFSDFFEFGGQLTLSDAAGADSIFLGGGTGNVKTTGAFQLVNTIGSGAAVRGSLALTGAGARLELADELGSRAMYSGAHSSGGGFLWLYQGDGGLGLVLDADSGGAGNISVKDGAGVTKVFLDVTTSNNNTGQINVHDGGGARTVEIVGQENTSPGGSQILMRNGSGTATIEVDADGGSGPRLQLFQNDGDAGVVMDGNSFANGSQGGGRIRVRNAANVTRVFIDGNYLNTGMGRIRADIIRVQGGVDLAEPFECKDKTDVKPGMVMSIDASSPGRLMIASQSYDRKVAGVVSGAGGVNPGITLSQEGVVEGDHLVALTGRVYVWCDATFGAIQPGDMLTTSTTPGHAMAAHDYAKARGAIIGKAMTSLASGKGLVMVLVQPQ